jgi:hypothetical protein
MSRCGNFARAFCGIEHSFAERLMIKILHRAKKALWVPISPLSLNVLIMQNGFDYKVLSLLTKRLNPHKILRIVLHPDALSKENPRTQQFECL